MNEKETMKKAEEEFKSISHWSWSTFSRIRKEARKAFPSVYTLPVRKKLFDVIASVHPAPASVLDVGASDRLLGDRLKKKHPALLYQTMDVDREQQHDYYDLMEIHQTYDMIIFSEVIEHLDFQEGLKTLTRLFGLLNDRGFLIVSTPNLHHPNRFWDIDHKTPYRYDDLAALLKIVGFHVQEINRVYNASEPWRAMRLYGLSWIHRLLDVDFAKSIVVVAEKV